MNNSLIQWPRAKYWNHAYNPFLGCEKISEGCQNCYAERVTEKFGINGGCFAPQYMPNAKPDKTGVVFVGNMTDVFGHWIPSHILWDIFDSLSPDAVNLILTKRADRLEMIANIWLADNERKEHYFGVTCENQPRADERIPHLLAAGVQNRWLSLEPLLGPMSINKIAVIECEKCKDGEYWTNTPNPSNCYHCGTKRTVKAKINWVVVGAESGPNRRECKIEWVESIVNQCLAAGVNVFVKQLHINGKLVDDINKFPEHLRIRQVPWFKEK